MIITYRMKGQGYLLNDNRAAGQGLKEDDIFSCAHCQALLEGKKYKEDGGWCGRCMEPLCGPCADKMLTEGCVPFKAKIDKILEEAYRRRQFSKIAGLE